MTPTVHPRVCGEQGRIARERPNAVGSSPRVRGTVDGLHHLRAGGRFIPACAGNRSASRRSSRAWTVHPRVCGEQKIYDNLTTSYNGSSPRVRGTGDAQVEQLLQHRFIPACAGNSPTSAASRTRSPVHPRVCGEQRRIVLRLSAESGSSPRVRGTELLPVLDVPSDRFIPACAGNSGMTDVSRTAGSVHPRVCGEQSERTCISRVGDGSSPRVRGTGADVHVAHVQRRFIPACAGNSPVVTPLMSKRTVHPRVCGEQRHDRDGRAKDPGSSPRVRGTVRGHPRAAARPRFIPACAGNSAEGVFLAIDQAVHPRVCGEQSSFWMRMDCRSGSSPRVRGTVVQHLGVLLGHRFIPACAGNSARPCCRATRTTVHPRVCGEQTRSYVIDITQVLQTRFFYRDSSNSQWRACQPLVTTPNSVVSLQT